MKQIETKYNGVLPWESYQQYLVNQVYKILPLMEEEKDWKRFVEGLIVELIGLEELTTNISFISLLGRLQGLTRLTQDQIDDDLFKKTIFDSIDLVKSLEPGE